MKILASTDNYTSADMEQKKQVIRDNRMEHLVEELNTNSTERGAIAAINWVYDSIVLSNEEFLRKYFG